MTSRDYSSFSSAAKPRFRHVARELGYEQLSGVSYARDRGGWFEAFGLQAAGHGNDFFYVNFGIAVPDLCPVADPIAVSDCGLLLWNRLRDVDQTGGFGRESKRAIEESSHRVLSQYKADALPWFSRFDSWDAIAAEFFRISPIDEARLGTHSVISGADLTSATYGYLLLKANRIPEALRWLREAERLMSLPVYFARDGRIVHEKEKYARFQKPEPYEIEALQRVRQTIDLVSS
jgi:hypothetical protein